METLQGLVEARESDEDKPKIDLEEVSNRILNKLVEPVDRQIKRVETLVEGMYQTQR